jgi:hypothetical protein
MKARKNNCDKSTFLWNRFDDSELIFNMYCDEYYRWLRARVKRWVLHFISLSNKTSGTNILQD